MQRDIGNEFIVAIIAVGILAFAVAFAIILSLSGGAGQGTTATPQTTAVVAQASTQTPTIEPVVDLTNKSPATVTVIPIAAGATTIAATQTATTTTVKASSTPTTEFKATQTTQALPTKTDVPTPTVIRVTNTTVVEQALVSSATPKIVSTTVAPVASSTTKTSVTPKASATYTATVRPTSLPSATPTRSQPSATATLKASATVVPPSATFTASPTVKPSATATNTATARPTLTATVIPTATLTPTVPPSATPRPTATATTIPTKTPIPPSPTSSIIVAATLVGTAAPCTIPTNWVSYTVRRGDTFLTIAQKAGTTIEALQAANCVANINNIFVGQVVYIPNQGSTSGNTSYKLEGCTDAGTQITNLTVGQLVSGVVSVEGSATVNNFAFYKLEIRPDSGKIYTLYNSYIKAVSQGILGEIDTRIFSPGIYWLKLTVITQDNQATRSCAVPLLFAQAK